MNENDIKTLIGDLVLQIANLNNQVNSLKQELDKCKLVQSSIELKQD